MQFVNIAALNVYPVKSCRGITLEVAQLGATGFSGDRHWMVADPAGRFVTQRECPALALIVPTPDGSQLRLNAPGMPELCVSTHADGERLEVAIWNDRSQAIDAGVSAAEWLSQFLRRPVRLVRFDPGGKRPSNHHWTGAVEALNEFSDGFPVLVASQSSLDDLNTRLPAPLPMNRFRPNLVLSGLAPYDEDRIDELIDGDVTLRLVKPCTRCKITTTDQASGEVKGPEPLLTLRQYRWNADLRGVTFAQNAIIVSGVGSVLRVGQRLGIRWKQ
jgi:uncharacterized protein YcbX